MVPLHILKLCVGIDDVEALRRAQTVRRARLRAAGEPVVLRHVTRHPPRRAHEILPGGSLYWVIKGFVRVRQRIVGFEELTDHPDGKRCAFVLGPRLVLTRWQPRRPHQGWRYLDATDAPVDANFLNANAGQSVVGKSELPPALTAELRALGLI